MRRTPSLILLLVSLLALASTAAAATKATQPQKAPFTLRPKFHLVASQAAGVVVSNRYVFFTTATGPVGTPATVGTLIDERTGHRTHLSPPGCPSFRDPVFGGPWLMLTCGYTGNEALYHLSTHTWKTVHSSCTVSTNEQGGCGAIAVGKYWIRLETSCYNCADSFSDQNIQTGHVRKDPEVVGGTKIADLDSPALATRLCRPLRIPSSTAPTPDNETEPGFLTRLGQFALASRIPPNNGAYFYLERCGSPLHKALPVEPPGSPASDSNAVIWANGPHRADGLSLPSLRPFRVQLPVKVGLGPLALSAKTLYVASSGQGPLWAAQLRLH